MADSPVTTKLYDRLQTEVHVWFCRPSLIEDSSKLADYKSVLSAEEIERFDRFHFEKDRHSYLLSHVLLRQSLSKYADVHASQWQFVTNEHGKPQLDLPSALPGIYFNLTHTDGLSACVVSLRRNCGIDAECTRRKNKLKAVAQRMFAEEEIVRLSDKNLDQQFYHFWTLREAYVKALGTGLAGSSKAFYFDIDESDLRVRLCDKNISQNNDKDWFFSLYQPTPQHVLAVGYQSTAEVPVVMTELTP